MLANTKTWTCLLAAIAALGGATGCEIPKSPYRYTAVVPGARPPTFDGRTAEEGSVRLEGSVTKTTVRENLLPQLHDTAVRVAEIMVDGNASLAVSSQVELGAHVAYGTYEWTRGSALGTMPLPSRPSTWGAGPELRAMFPLTKDERLTFGFALNLMYSSLPYGEWVLTGPSSPDGRATCTVSPTCVGDQLTLGRATYELFKESRDSFWTLGGGIYPAYSFREYGHVFGYFAAHTQYKNDGFTDRVSNGSTLDTNGYVWLLGLGYGIEYDVLRASGSVFLPLTSERASVAYAVGGMLTIGIQLPLWEPKKKKAERLRKEHEHDAPEAAPAAAPPPAAPPPQQPQQPQQPQGPQGPQQPGVQYIYVPGPVPAPAPAPPPPQ